MGDVFRLKATEAQRALARYREEERAFEVVLRVASEWRRHDLFLRVFTLYRSRMTHLRRLLGPLLAGVERRSAFEDLSDLGADRRPR